MLKTSILAIVTIALLYSANPAASVVDDLGGASPPRPDMTLRRDWQYKRVHQVALRYILLKRYDEAEQFLKDFIESHPDDAESQYMLGLLYAQTDQPEQAVNALKKALELGLPPGRIVAGPRSLFEPIANREFYRKLVSEYASIPVHGPLLGEVSDTTASIWVRTTEASPVTLIVSKADDAEAMQEFAAIESKEQDDYTVVLRAEKLEPGTIYNYAIRIADGPVLHNEGWWFETFPKPGQGTKFAAAFGGGAGYVPDNEHMWDTIASFHPQVLLLLGDNVYIDDPESPVMQRYTYYRRQSRPEWRALTSHTAVFTIWDDHDFSTNDSWGGPLVDKPSWKQQSVWPIFEQNWANPAYAGGEEYPGCWYRFAIGDVEFFMLDCRYYRTDPKSDAPSMLGPVQLAWLKQQLTESTATFNVICSSVPWDFRTKGDSSDTWNGFKDEREAIFSFIEEQGIEGVVLLSADRHRTDAWQISRPQGYDFYEFNSSRLTNLHVHPTMEKQGALFSYNKKQSFGLVTFDTTVADPTVKYDVISIDGEVVYTLELKRSQMQAE